MLPISAGHTHTKSEEAVIAAIRQAVQLHRPCHLVNFSNHKEHYSSPSISVCLLGFPNAAHQFVSNSHRACLCVFHDTRVVVFVVCVEGCGAEEGIPAWGTTTGVD